jgi:hypothetical protein
VSWYNSSWPHRAAISVDNTAGATGSADVTVAIPIDFDLFWNNVLASGNDVRVTTADGITLATYDLAAGFDTSTRSGTIELDNVSLTSGKMHVFWLYWGYASASDARSAVTPSSPKTGYIEVGAPIEHLVRALPERPGETRPRVDVSKGSGETTRVYFDFGSSLARRVEPYQSHLLYEEISQVSYQVIAAGTPDPSLVTAANTRIVHPAIVGVELKDGSSGTDYTVVVTVVTSTSPSRTLARRARLRVIDVAET